MKKIRNISGGILALCLFGTMSAVQAQEAFRIAGIVPLSGAYGIIGENMRRGATIAFEERNHTVLGKPIQVIWEDSETSAQVAVQKATRILARETHTLFGTAVSGATLALMTLTKQRKIPHLVTISADDRITGADKSRYTFRTSNPVAMEWKMIVEFARQRGLKKIYGIVGDNSVGRNLWDDIRGNLEKSGIQVVGTDYAPIGTSDYAVLLDKALQSGADGLVPLTTGSDAIALLKQGGEVDLPKKLQIIGTLLMDETLGQSVGPAGALGVHSTMRYHFSQDAPRNKEFVRAYRAKYGALPDQYAGEAYDGMSWWLDTVESTGVWDKEAWVDAFRTSVRADSVEGEKRMRACDNQAEQVGLFGTAVAGTGDLPAITMQVSSSFSAQEFFTPCQ